MLVIISSRSLCWQILSRRVLCGRTLIPGLSQIHFLPPLCRPLFLENLVFDPTSTKDTVVVFVVVVVVVVVVDCFIIVFVFSSVSSEKGFLLHSGIHIEALIGPSLVFILLAGRYGGALQGIGAE